MSVNKTRIVLGVVALVAVLVLVLVPVTSTVIFPNKHPGPSRNFGLWGGGALPCFGVFSLLGNKVSVFSFSIFTKGCLLGNMWGGGALPDRDSLLLVPTGRARVLIREYHSTRVLG